MKLSDIVEVSAAVGRTRSRLKKRALLAECLRRASADEIRLAVSYLVGSLPQGKIGIGYTMLRDLETDQAESDASTDLAEVDAAFQRIAGISGKGSRTRRLEELTTLFSAVTPEEQDFLKRLILGELRQGALEGVLVEAVADAAGLPAAGVRRALMLATDPALVADVALNEGAAGLARFRLEPLTPVKPMLAQPAETIDGAMQTLGEAALEYKLDGARVQIHRQGDEVRIFSRALNEVTASLPEIVEATLTLRTDSAILDGEVIALGKDGRPLPFQVTMRRFGRKSNVAEMRSRLPLSLFLFDCLYASGEELIDRAYAERVERLAALTSPEFLVPRLRTGDVAEATAYLSRALGEGHEGLMAKSLTSTYAAGNRGAEWLKIKQAHTLDLVILAAEWGSGRRKGWLSNLHLGARDPDTGQFVMLGKTFKGMTDKMLDWQTRRLLKLETERSDYAVHVRPEIVVEIAVNEIQASLQYPAGMALRFARVKRYRKDKSPDDADTIETVRRLFVRQNGQESAASADSD